MSEYDCSWSSNVLTVTFTLNQLTDLNDPDILADDATAISAASFSFTGGGILDHFYVFLVLDN